MTNIHDFRRQLQGSKTLHCLRTEVSVLSVKKVENPELIFLFHISLAHPEKVTITLPCHSILGGVPREITQTYEG